MSSDREVAPTSDPGQVLVDWLRGRFGNDVELKGTSETSGDGFDSEIHFVSLTGSDVPEGWRGPLVLRIKPDVDRFDIALREMTIQNWCAEAGLPVPRVLEVLEPGEPFDRPAQVMERAPGVMLLAVLLSSPWRFRSLMGELAKLHAQVHRADPDGFPPGDDLLDRRLALTRDTAERLDHEPLRRALTDVEVIAPRLRGGPPTVCHGDFHPLNVIVGPGGLQLIDWTDAGVGDRHGDVARTLLLFSVAWLAAGSASERLALRAAGPMLGRAYRRAYRREFALDEERVALWTPVHLLHGWSQAIGVKADLFASTDQSGNDERVPDSLAGTLESRFQAALAAVT
ncbi:MAG TPA: phosphotransferase [Acidimicrobiales bacterium]|nr:phosphotransferase [Acidimicrobiales bacterium]